jgi:hypothetical protein
MLTPRTQSKFYAAKIFGLAKGKFSVELGRSLKPGGSNSALSQSNVWEPGEIPGRLRHCNGYNFQCHRCKSGRRNEVRCRSQDTGLIALVGPALGALLRKEKDEASPPKPFLGGSSNFLHSSFAKSGGFLFSKTFRPRAGLSTKTVP